MNDAAIGRPQSEIIEIMYSRRAFFDTARLIGLAA
jgi:hypothetical protein